MEKASKKKLINEYHEGEGVQDIFVVKFKKGVSDYTKGYYFSLVLTDSSGKSIDYKYWGGADENKVKEIYSPIKEDSVLYIEGQFSFYNNKPQIVSNEANVVKIIEKGQYSEEDFIKKTAKDIEAMYPKLEEYIEKVKDEKLKLLLKSIFLQVGASFKKHPAAISIHHNWVGGLLEHVLEVLRYCELSAELFPELNKDLLITGALLHDIGKLEEMEMTTRIKGTNKGMFSGHVVLGSIFVSNKMDELGIDEETKNKVLHMMVSHHGKIEYGALKEPMFPEAIALHYADESSSKIVEMLNFIRDSKDETENDFMYHYKKNLNIFLR